MYESGLRDILVPVMTWSGLVILCIGFGAWLLRLTREMDEEESPGRVACFNCGYDLRATPDRCPECGHLPPPPEPEEEPDMPIYAIPEDAGPFVVVESRDGGFAVADEAAAAAGPNAAKLGLVFIPCRDEAQANAIRDRLNRGEHDGTIQVDLLSPPVDRTREAQ